MAINTGAAFTETTPESAETTLIQATAGEITLPEGFSLTTADFARVGSDLVLTGSGASQSTIEAFLGLDAGSLDSLNGNATDGSAISTTVTVKAGDVVSIDWMFDANDYLPYNDFSFAAVIGGEVIELSELSDVADVGNYGDSGWQTFSFTATEDGDVDIGLGVMNLRDTALDPHLLVDNLRINDPNIDVSPSVDIA